MKDHICVLLTPTRSIIINVLTSTNKMRLWWMSKQNLKAERATRSTRKNNPTKCTPPPRKRRKVRKTSPIHLHFTTAPFSRLSYIQEALHINFLRGSQLGGSSRILPCDWLPDDGWAIYEFSFLFILNVLVTFSDYSWTRKEKKKGRQDHGVAKEWFKWRAVGLNKQRTLELRRVCFSCILFFLSFFSRRGSQARFSVPFSSSAWARITLSSPRPWSIM